MTEFSVVDKLELAEQNVLNLQNEVEMMKRHLEKEKKFHRQYVDTVVKREEVTIKNFEKEIKALKHDNSYLNKINKMLIKDNQYLKLSASNFSINETHETHNREMKKELNKFKKSNENYKLVVKGFRSNKTIMVGKIKKLTNLVTKHENKQSKSVMMRKELDQLIKRKKTNREHFK